MRYEGDSDGVVLYKLTRYFFSGGIGEWVEKTYIYNAIIYFNHVIILLCMQLVTHLKSIFDYWRFWNNRTYSVTQRLDDMYNSSNMINLGKN